jgi:hypothetical protein
MTKRILLFAAKFVILAVPLTWLWMEWGRGAYGRFFSTSVAPLYQLFDLEMGPGGARERYVNYIPFLVLMFVTPRLSLTRRVLGTCVGFLAIFTFHVVFSIWVQIAYPPGAASTQSGFAIYLPAILLSDSLPLILWALLCPDFVREAGAKAFGKLGLGAPKAASQAAGPAAREVSRQEVSARPSDPGAPESRPSGEA